MVKKKVEERRGKVVRLSLDMLDRAEALQKKMTVAGVSPALTTIVEKALDVGFAKLEAATS